MSTITINEIESRIENSPGAQLAAVRLAKGQTVEYIAAKLHLRIELIQKIEADDYSKMPEAVFVKGYIRAYAKLMDLNPDPFLEIYNKNYVTERKTEKTLWQTRKDTSQAERSIRWMTTAFGLAVLVSVTIWWYKSQDNQDLIASAVNTTQIDAKIEPPESEIRLTDLSKMRSILYSDIPYNTIED